MSDVISPCSEQNSLVLFLGAGASSWAGYRTFLDFPAMFWPSGSDPSKLDVTDKERTLLDEIRGYLNKRRLPPTLDSYLAAIHEFQEFTSQSVSQTILRKRLLTSSLQWASIQELRQLLITIRNRVCRLTARHYRHRPNPRDPDAINQVYGFFDQLCGIPSSRLSVFTTNYDLLPEYLFSGCQHFKDQRPQGSLPPFDLVNGFPSLSDHWSPDLPEQQPWVFQPSATVQSSAANRRVVVWYRLHGCVAWLHGGVGDDKIYFSLRDPEQIENFADKLCVSYPGHEQCYGLNPYAWAFQSLADAVVSARLIVFVGFAFRDTHVMAVIGRSLYELERANRRLPTVLIVDPQLTEQEVLSRITESQTAVAGPHAAWDKVNFEVLPVYFPDSRVCAKVKDLWQGQSTKS